MAFASETLRDLDECMPFFGFACLVVFGFGGREGPASPIADKNSLLIWMGTSRELSRTSGKWSTAGFAGQFELRGG